MKRLIVVTGPTASGKTEVAISLAQETGGAVVSADSRQLYVGMNIGTAKPEFAGQEPHGHLEPDIVQDVPHYLFNVRTPNKPLSLSEWQSMAFAAIDKIHVAGTPAVLAGGTMLYIDSIVKNYDLPRVAPNEELRAALEIQPTEVLYTELLRKDPAAKDFIQPLNKRRIVRALEVMAATNQPFSVQRRRRPPRYEVMMVGLFDSWEALEKRIVKRIEQMFTEGLLEETRSLIDRYGADVPLLQTMNYKQAMAVIAGTLTPEAAQQEMLRANYKYARRQMSWWRGRTDITWYSPSDYEGIKKQLLINL